MIQFNNPQPSAQATSARRAFPQSIFADVDMDGAPDYQRAAARGNEYGVNGNCDLQFKLKCWLTSRRSKPGTFS